jgi:hypothetical protein
LANHSQPACKVGSIARNSTIVEFLRLSLSQPTCKPN